MPDNGKPSDERRRFQNLAEQEGFYEQFDSLERRVSACEDKASDIARAKLLKDASEAVFDSIYRDVGRNFVRAVLWALGLAGVGLLTYFAATGKLKL